MFGKKKKTEMQKTGQKPVKAKKEHAVNWNEMDMVRVTKFMSRYDAFKFSSKLYITQKLWWAPILNKYGYKAPVLMNFIILPTGDIILKPAAMNLNNTIELETRTLQLNPKKIYDCMDYKFVFWRHDSIEPLTIDKDSIIPKDYEPATYKKAIESKVEQALLTVQDEKMGLVSKITLGMVIVVLVFVFVLVAQMAGWIDLKAMLSGIGGS